MIVEPFRGPLYDGLIAAEAALVAEVLAVHREPQVLATAEGPVLYCGCAGWVEPYENPDSAAAQHLQHVADRAVRRLRGWPL